MVQGFPVTSTLTATVFQEHVPKVKGEHGRAWILGGPRKSTEVLRWPSHSLCRFWENLTPTDLSEHVAAQGYRLPSDHPELLVCDEWPGMDVNACHTNLRDFRPSSWPASRKHKPNGSHYSPQNCTTGLFCSQETCVLSPYRIYNKPKGHMYW